MVEEMVVREGVVENGCGISGDAKSVVENGCGFWWWRVWIFT